MKSFANAVGGKTARACYSCVKRRARWYCAADDAFLCQVCDGSVHSANPLARRHERVRLKSASSGAGTSTWHQGFTRKPRTPRGCGPAAKQNQRPIFHDLVPEISVEDQTENCEEEQLIFQVPVLDPFVAEQCRNVNNVVGAKTGLSLPVPVRMEFSDINDEDDEYNAESCLNGFFPTEMELAEFSADVETLLGRNLDTESFSMKEIDLDCEKSSSMILKVENNDIDERDNGNVAPFELSFHYEPHEKCQEEEEDDDKENVIKVNNGKGESERSSSSCRDNEKKDLMLKLDHEAVISTWGDKPWTAGEPPKFDFDNDTWSISMGDNGREGHSGHCGLGLRVGFEGGGREARVLRYREKRRTRLFSKKIRYEVRKLNAEKRPRMKGRFVKRSSLAALTSSFSGSY